MKKNRTMRAASLMLVLTLITCCFVGGTFSKYITSDNGDDTARVAKWGVVVNVEGNTFENEYESDTDEYTEKTVISTTDDVVAPGTEGTLADATVTGKPEVAVEVSYDAELTLANWEVSDSEYCPLVFTVEGETYSIGEKSITDIDTLIAKVEEAIENCKNTYPANEEITMNTDAPSIEWSWPYSTEGNDANDTALGNATTAASITLALTTTATQID